MADRRDQFIPITNRAGTARLGAPSRSRGFSFTEILFAVVVLGIGFIMVAAIFPVAIQQGKLTTEQGTATGVAREALGYLNQVGANSDAIANSQGGPLFPATGIIGSSAPYLGMVYSFRDPQPAGASEGTVALSSNIQPTNDSLINGTVANRQTDEVWSRINLSLIVPSDQRYAFVGLYRRNGDPTDRRTWSPFAQVWFIPVTARNRSTYSPSVDPFVTGTAPNQVNPNLQARLVRVQIYADPTNSNSYVLYNYTSAVTNYTPGSLSDGCYVIIANDESATKTLDGVANPDIGRMNGRVYHVGFRRPDLDATDSTFGAYQAYDLAPDGTFTPDVGADGLFGINPNVAADAALTPPVIITKDDDILAIGNTTAVGLSQIVANGPADAYVVGLDYSGVAPDQGTSQEISAFTTFIKVN